MASAPTRALPFFRNTREEDHAFSARDANFYKLMGVPVLVLTRCAVRPDGKPWKVGLPPE